MARASTGEPFRRMAAAAAVAAGVTTLATACGASSGSNVAFYGAPGIVPEAGTDSSTDSPSAVAFYGIGNPATEDAVAPTDASAEASDSGAVDGRDDG